MSQSTTSKMAGSPSATVAALISGYMASQVVHVAARLRVADLLADGPKSADMLADEAAAHAPSLHRLLRALASLGLLDEIGPARFALTTLGAQLRADAPDSLRNRALLFAGDRHWRSWGELLHSVRTGATQMQHLYGIGAFEYLAAHPEESEIFNKAMAEITRQVAREAVAACDFSRFRTLIDVGGGNGTLIAAILAATPALRGTVFDLPSGNADARHQLEAAGVAARCEVESGDFFQSVPAGADAYILKSIIHDWNDERSIAILRNCRAAMSSDGRLLLVERVMPRTVDTSQSHRQMAMADLHMLVLAGGRERTVQEYETLFAAAGFALVGVTTLSQATGVCLIEAEPT